MQYKIVVDKQPMTNPSNEKKEYIIDIEELRAKGSIHDSLMFEIDKTYVIRRLKLSEYYVLSVLDEPIIEALESINIELFEGDNYIYLIDMQGNKFYAEYLIKNEFNDVFATRKEMNSAIDLTMQQITIAVNQKFTDYSTTQEMNSAIQLSAQSITNSVSETYATKETTNQLSTRIKQTAKSIDLTATDNNISAGITIKLKNEDGTQIDSKSANITMSGLVKFTDLSQSGATTINGSNITTGTIDASKVTVSNLNASNITSGTINGRAITGGTITGTSITNGNNFSVDKNGNMTCTNATVNGTIISNNATITGGLINLISSNHEANFQITEYGGGSQSRCFSGGMTFEDLTYSSIINITTLLSDPLISVNNDDNSTYIHASYIDTPQLICPDVTPSSTEGIKKNILKFTKHATEIINNADIYEYNLKTDKDTDRKMIGFVIGDKYRTPDEVLSKDGEAVRLYSIACILWKGFQEQEEKINKLMEVVR